jgi:hypothetical protein
MRSPGIPRHRIAKRSGHAGDVHSDHLAEMAVLPNPPNADLKKGRDYVFLPIATKDFL